MRVPFTVSFFHGSIIRQRKKKQLLSQMNRYNTQSTVQHVYKKCKPVLWEAERQGGKKRCRLCLVALCTLCRLYVYRKPVGWQEEKSRVVSRQRKRTYLSSPFSNFRESGCRSLKTYSGERIRLIYRSFHDSSAFHRSAVRENTKTCSCLLSTSFARQMAFSSYPVSNGIVRTISKKLLS